MPNYSVSKHAFPKKEDCSTCPIRKSRIKQRDQLTEEIKFLNSMGFKTPKAEAHLESIKGYLRDCALDRCGR